MDNPSTEHPSKTNGRIHIPPSGSTPPPQAPEPSRKSQTPWIIAGVLGVTAVVGIVLLLTIATLAFVFFSHRSYSTENDLISTPATSESDYLSWRSAMDRLGQPGPATAAPVGAAPGWWDKQWNLPPDAAVTAALTRRLPPGMTVESITPAVFTQRPDGTQATYHLKLRSAGTLLAVSPAPLLPEKTDSPQLRKWLPLLIASQDLPAGMRYAPETARMVVQAGQLVETDWTVRRTARENGKWKIIEADPIVYQRMPSFERRLLTTPGVKPVLLRAESEVSAARAQETQVRQQTEATIIDIQSRVAVFKSEAMADLPRAGVDTGGRSGSGTPTKTGIGVASGAAVGGGVGAVAGRGEGAAIGAGAGALLGGIIAYNVGRSDEKRAAAAQNSARQQAINAANNRTRAFESQLYQEAEANLKALANAHNARLASLY